MTSGGEIWLDRDAGPVVRPYALTRGRTRPPSSSPGLIDVVSAIVDGNNTAGLGPEHRSLLALCREPITVADLASDVELPLGTVRVLLGDLRERDLIRVAGSAHEDSSEEGVLRSVLDGLRAL